MAWLGNIHRFVQFSTLEWDGVHPLPPIFLTRTLLATKGEPEWPISMEMSKLNIWWAQLPLPWDLLGVPAFHLCWNLPSKIQSCPEKQHQRGPLREEALLWRQDFLPGDRVANKFCLRDSGHKEQKGIWAARWWEKGSGGRRGLEWQSAETVLNIWNLQLYFPLLPLPELHFFFFFFLSPD